MTAELLPPPPPPEALLPGDVLTQVRETRARINLDESRILQLACEWADIRPALAGDESWRPAPVTGTESWLEDPEHANADDLEWFGIPPVRWDAPAAFAAANGVSTASGRALMRDALVLRHRLSRTWERVVGGEVPLTKARLIAQAVLGQPADVVLYIDQVVAPRAHQVGPVVLERLIDEAMLTLHAEERELEQLAALDAQYARLDPAGLNHTGITEMVIRGDWTDLSAFDRALSLIASLLGQEDQPGFGLSLDRRRAMAVGVLADPERALALINGGRPPKPKREVVAYLHLDERSIRNLDPVTTDECGRPILTEVVQGWLKRADTHVTVKPLLDLTKAAVSGLTHAHEQHATHDYVPSAEDRDLVILRDRRCRHPYCTRLARQCDLDHRIPHAEGGPTCPCNLTPLCRHHHRLKTKAGWRARSPEPGVYHWTDPYGREYLVDQDVTRDLTPS
ncbi:HNH endonuclease signature motif containing protein [Nocardioides dilutus]